MRGSSPDGSQHDGPQRGAEPGTRAEVLQALKDAAAPLTIAGLAQKVGVHPNTIRFHLARLVERAQVERVFTQHRAPGRPAQLFQVAPGMDPAGPRNYRALATALVRSVATGPEPKARALKAGWAWGHALASSASDGAAHSSQPGPKESVLWLRRMLDELGFAPQQDESEPASWIGLRHCPFLELAIEQPEVVCPLHLGLMQGAMHAWRAPLGVHRLDRFVTADLCLAHLSATPG